MTRTNTRRQCLKVAAALAVAPAMLGAAQGPSTGLRVAYAILMLDKPGSKAVRDAYRAAHFAYLTSFRDKLVVSGAISEEDGSAFKGGLIVLEVPTRKEAEAFVESDPFTRAGLQESTQIERIRLFFFNGERLPS